MENEKFVTVSLSPEDVAVLRSVLGQYIFNDEHFVCRSTGEVLKRDGYSSSWGHTPLGPLLERLKDLQYSYRVGDALVIKKSC